MGTATRIIMSPETRPAVTFISTLRALFDKTAFAFLVYSAAAVVAKVPVTIPDAATSWTSYPVVQYYDSLFIDWDNSSGEHTVTIREVMWFGVNERPIPPLRELSYSYNSFIEKRPGLNVTVYDRAGKMYRVPRTAIRLDDSNDRKELRHSLYIHNIGTYTLSAQLPHAERIAMVRSEITRHHRKAVFAPQLFLRESYPTARKYFRITIPESLADAVRLLNSEKLPVDTARSIVKHRVIMEYSCGPLEPFPEETVICPEKWYSTIALRLPARGTAPLTWQAAGDYYLDLIEPLQKPSAAIDSIARGITDNRDSAVTAVFSFITNHTRYYGSWEGIYGYIPRPAAEVLANGYGDCKELSMLCCTLLRKKGVEAYPALVNGRKAMPQLLPAFPSLSPFNHVVVAIAGSDGYRYVDPTVPGRAQASCFYTNNRRTLVVRRDGSEIDSVRPPGNYVNAVTTRSVISRLPSGDWSISGTIRLNGDAAQYFSNAYLKSTDDDRNDQIKKYLRSVFSITPQTVTVEKTYDDSIGITFTAAFDDRYITAPKTGFLLDIPSFNKMVLPVSPANSGAIWLTPDYTQTDVWELPDRYPRSSTAALNLPFITGTWQTGTTTVTRNVTVISGTFIRSATDTCSLLIKEKNDFEQGTVWKK